MPKFFLKRSNAEGTVAIDLGARVDAWPELKLICSDLARTIIKEMPVNSTWEIEIQDEDRRPLYRIKLIAEASQPARLYRIATSDPADDPPP